MIACKDCVHLRHPGCAKKAKDARCARYTYHTSMDWYEGKQTEGMYLIDTAREDENLCGASAKGFQQQEK